MAMIYTVNTFNGHDEYTGLITRSLEEARKAAAEATVNLTKSELKNTTCYIQGWDIVDAPELPAQDVWEDWADEQCWLPDPDFYEEVPVVGTR